MISDKAKKNISRTVNIIEWALIGLLVVFVAFVLVFASGKPGNDGKGSGSLFGYETRLVLTSSMDAKPEYYEQPHTKNYEIKNIHAGELVFIRDFDLSTQETAHKSYVELKVGDVVTYQSLKYGEVITHRIIGIQEANDVIYFTIKGDAVDDIFGGNSEIVASNSLTIFGKVIGHSAFLGALYTGFLNNKVLIYIIIMIPTSFMIVYEIYRIVKVVSEGKAQKRLAQEKAKEDEIEDLKRRLEEIQNKQKDKEE